MVTGRRTLTAAIALVAFVAGALVFTGTASAAPAACDPFYGCPTTTLQQTSPPSCSISSSSVTPGQSVTVHVENVDPGTSLSVTFDGTVVGQGTASQQGGQASGSADIGFTVPSASPGTHSVFVTGANVECDPTNGGGVQVLGEQVGAPGGGATNGGSTPSTSTSSLARTGIEVGVLLAVALVLLIAGYQLVRAGRRRRRRANRVSELQLH